MSHRQKRKWQKRRKRRTRHSRQLRPTPRTIRGAPERGRPIQGPRGSGRQRGLRGAEGRRSPVLWRGWIAWHRRSRRWARTWRLCKPPILSGWRTWSRKRPGRPCGPSPGLRRRRPRSQPRAKGREPPVDLAQVAAATLYGRSRSRKRVEVFP